MLKDRAELLNKILITAAEDVASGCLMRSNFPRSELSEILHSMRDVPRVGARRIRIGLVGTLGQTDERLVKEHHW